MNSHVHIAIGATASLAAASLIPFMTPEADSELYMGTALAAAGAVIPDIDLNGSSKIKKGALSAVMVVIAAGAVIYKAGRVDTLISFLGLRLLFGILLLTFCMAWGLMSRHRSFTHSFFGMVLFGASIYLLLGLIPMAWFSIAMFSHSLADTLNMTKVRWLYPSKKGAALGLCRSSGFIAELFGLIFTVTAVLLFRRLWYML